MAPESPQVRDALVRLVERDVKVVQFLAGQERLESADYVGVDNTEMPRPLFTRGRVFTEA